MNIREWIIRKLGGFTLDEHLTALEAQRVLHRNFVQKSIVPLLDRKRVIPLTSGESMVAGFGSPNNVQGVVLAVGDCITMQGVSITGSLIVAPWCQRGYFNCLHVIGEVDYHEKELQ